MKKILIAFDGTEFSERAFQFAKELHALEPALLTGVFIPQVSYDNLWSYAGTMAGPVYIPLVEEEEGKLIQENIERFQSLCSKNNIACKVHRDFRDFALPELKRETRFADLLIISSEKFFENMVRADKDDYLKNAIHEAECPVIVIPESFSFPDRNIIAYDGTASSVFALKQFAYLFPELSVNETLLIYSGEDETSGLPSEEYLEELASQHYKNLELLKIQKNPKKYFREWLKTEANLILITGAFGRSAFSQLFKKSFVTDIIADHNVPVFIAHR